MDYSFCDELLTSLLQFASVFCTEIAVEKNILIPRNVTSGGALGSIINFLGSLSLATFYGPLINYAVIRRGGAPIGAGGHDPHFSRQRATGGQS